MKGWTGDWTDPETGKTTHLSGHHYIQMRLRDAPTPESDIFRPTPIRVRCNHEFTVCLECLPEWDADYEIAWDRTAGGRRMLAAAHEACLTLKNAD